VGAWRGVNTNQNGVYMECFINECAVAAAMRFTHLGLSREALRRLFLLPGTLASR
jgi:hypothetical protein